MSICSDISALGLCDAVTKFLEQMPAFDPTGEALQHRYFRDAG
jgi:hypothetical protein